MRTMPTKEDLIANSCCAKVGVLRLYDSEVLNSSIVQLMK